MKAAKNIQLLALLQNSIEPKATKKQSFFSFGNFMQNILKAKSTGKNNLNSGLIRFGTRLPKASTLSAKGKQNIKVDVKPARIKINSFEEFAHLLGSSVKMDIVKQVKTPTNNTVLKETQTDNTRVQPATETEVESIKNTLIQGLFLSQQDQTTPQQWQILNKAIPGLSFKMEKKSGKKLLSVNVADQRKLKIVQNVLSKLENKAGQRHVSIPKIKISTLQEASSLNRVKAVSEGKPDMRKDLGEIVSGGQANVEKNIKNSSGKIPNNTKKKVETPHRTPENRSVPKFSKNTESKIIPNTDGVKKAGENVDFGTAQNVKHPTEIKPKDLLLQHNQKVINAGSNSKTLKTAAVKQAAKSIRPDNMAGPISKTKKTAEHGSVKDHVDLKHETVSRQNLKPQPVIDKIVKKKPAILVSTVEKNQSAGDKLTAMPDKVKEKTQDKKVPLTSKNKSQPASAKIAKNISSGQNNTVEKISHPMAGKQTTQPNVSELPKKSFSAEAPTKHIKAEAHKNVFQTGENGKGIPVKDDKHTYPLSEKPVKTESGKAGQTEVAPNKTVSEKLAANHETRRSNADSASSNKIRMESVREQPVSTQQVRRQVEKGKIKVRKRNETIRIKTELPESKPAPIKAIADTMAQKPTKEPVSGNPDLNRTPESVTEKTDFTEPETVKKDSKQTISPTLNQPGSHASSIKAPAVPPKFQPLVTRLQEMITKFNAIKKSVKTNTSFRIESSPAGKMEIQFEEKNGHKQIKVLVETEATRHELQKAVPQLQQNLNSKGIELIGFTVQVSQFGNKTGQAAPHNKPMRHKNKETREVQHEADKSTVVKRNYGYNTIEVIA